MNRSTDLEEVWCCWCGNRLLWYIHGTECNPFSQLLAHCLLEVLQCPSKEVFHDVVVPLVDS